MEIKTQLANVEPPEHTGPYELLPHRHGLVGCVEQDLCVIVGRKSPHGCSQRSFQDIENGAHETVPSLPKYTFSDAIEDFLNTSTLVKSPAQGTSRAAAKGGKMTRSGEPSFPMT